MLLIGLSVGTFDGVLILTGGGPGTATVTPALYSYRQAFGVNDWPTWRGVRVAHHGGGIWRRPGVPADGSNEAVSMSWLRPNADATVPPPYQRQPKTETGAYGLPLNSKSAES
jgi:hypothetical protein